MYTNQAATEPTLAEWTTSQTTHGSWPPYSHSNQVTCEHCRMYHSTYQDITTSHYSVCACYPVECSNKCGAVLQRQNLKSHEAKDCPLTVIDCDFHYAGCEVRLPRQEMREHLMFKATKHLSMLAVIHQQLVASQQQQQTQSHQFPVSYQQQSLGFQQYHDQQTIDKLVKENESLRQRVSELQREQETDRAMIKSLQAKTNFPPVDIVMPNFSRQHNMWFSPPFYTHHRGYKLCLRCDPSANHIAVYICMMRGEFDDELKWPFRGEVTLQLLSQDGSNRHHTETIILNDPSFFSRVTERERSRFAKGETNFISLDECNRGYLTNDKLYFRIVSIKMT